MKVLKILTITVAVLLTATLNSVATSALRHSLGLTSTAWIIVDVVYCAAFGLFVVGYLMWENFRSEHSCISPQS